MNPNALNSPDETDEEIMLRYYDYASYFFLILTVVSLCYIFYLRKKISQTIRIIETTADFI